MLRSEETRTREAMDNYRRELQQHARSETDYEAAQTRWREANDQLKAVTIEVGLMSVMV